MRTKPGVDLGLLERVVAAHVDLAVAHERAAGAADAALAGERQVGAGRLGGVEDRLRPRGIGVGRAEPVEDDRDLAGLALDDGVGAVQLRRRLVDVEQLEVHPVLGDAELGEHLAGRRSIMANGPHSQTSSTSCTGTSRSSSRRSRSASSRPEKSSTSRGSRRQHVDELEPRPVAVLEVGQLLGEHHRAGGAVAVEEGDLGVGVGQHRARRSTASA